MSLLFGNRHFPSFFDQIFHELDPLQSTLCQLANKDSEEEQNQVVDNEKEFQTSLDVSQFKPDELNVNLDGRLLTVEGNQQVEDDNGSFQRYVSTFILFLFFC